MSTENRVYIPPIVVDDIEDFRRFARDAALVTFAPEYFNGPFQDDRGRLRRITLMAVGVPVRGMPLTFKCVIDYHDLRDLSREWSEQSEDIHLLLAGIVEQLDTPAPVVQGTLDTGRPLGQVLSARI